MMKFFGSDDKFSHMLNQYESSPEFDKASGSGGCGDDEDVVAPTTAKQSLAKKNELKERGTLLMALPDTHQLKFNIHKDAKSLREAIEKRFGGNKETKKVQKTLFKKQYENFSGSSSESLDQIHDMLQKLISQLEILADLEDQSLDALSNNLKIYEAEVKSSSSTSHNTQNIAFVSSQNTDSTNESSNSPQLDNDDLKQIDADDLEEMDLKWQMAMLTMRERTFLQRTGRNLGANGTTSIGFDMAKVKCYNCHRRGHFAKECRSPKDTRNKDAQRRNIPVETTTSNALVSQCDGVEDIKLLKLDVMLRDNALVELRKKFKKYEKERDELKLTLEKLQTSSKNLSKLQASQITDKTGLGYDNQMFPSTMFNFNELNKSELDVSVPTSLVHDRYKLGEGYHAVPPPYTGTFMPYKPDLVFHNASTVSETFPTVFNVKPSTTKPTKELSQTSVKPVEHPTPAKNLRKDILKSREDGLKACMEPCNEGQSSKSARMTHPHSKKHVVPTAVLTRSKLIPLNDSRPVTTVVPQANVKHQRPAKNVVNKLHSPIRMPINHKQAPKNRYFHQKVTTVKAKQVNVVQGYKGNWGNPQQDLKDKGVIDNGCSRHMTGNISYLFEFEEINEGYVAFGGNPKCGKIIGKGKNKTGKLNFDDVYFVKELKFNLFSVSQMCDKKNDVLFTDNECVVLSSDFKLPDENHMLLRVPRENNKYNVSLKNIVLSGDLTCLFTKATLDESNIWHRRLGHINFKTMNKLVKGNLVRGLPSKVFKNNHTCIACKKGKQHRASWIKREFSVAKTPQHNRVVERKNMTLIEAARTMLADLLLPIPFWAKVYVDDIIFGSNNKELCKAFEKLMKDKFQMSSIENLLFFGITTSTPIDTEKPLLKDPDGEDVDVHIYSNEALAIPGQTTNGKENLNPFMADSLPITILLTKLAVKAQWKFLIHMIVQCLSAKRTAWNEFSSSMASAVICLATDDLSSHSTKYTSPAITQKVSANMRSIGKGFSGVETPLFDAMLVQQQVQDDAEVEEDEDDDNETCTTLTQKVANLEQDKIAQALEITKLKQRVRRLEKKRITKHSSLKRFKKVGEEIAELDADEDVTLKDVDVEVAIDTNIQGRMAESQAKSYHLDLQHAEKVLSMHDTDEAEPNEVEEVLEDEAFTRQFEAELNANINWDDVPEQVKRREKQDNTVMRYQALKMKLVIEAQARKNMMIYLKNMVGFKMDFFKEKGKNEIEEERSKRKGENLEHDTAKRQRIEEEAEELKRHLHIMVNDDDDVFTEATPLASKVPVVDYQIHHENNKPYYKIIRADGTHKLFLSFITLLKNFNREDLEALWKLVEERFEAIEPKNFSDDFLLSTLKIMFKKPNVEANMILLVEKKYPLTHFTLEQMLNNVRLKVEEESEMSLELL
nr:ribonuclease H-like domain-containing protein [Tanacetum cinerariifolium]